MTDRPLDSDAVEPTYQQACAEQCAASHFVATIARLQAEVERLTSQFAVLNESHDNCGRDRYAANRDRFDLRTRLTAAHDANEKSPTPSGTSDEEGT